VISEMKKRLQRKSARRGFTLVELLIVIIIIGILAGAMMLVAGTSRDAAEASKIISDLRSVKAAAVMLLTENPNVTSYSWDGSGTKTLTDLPKSLSDDPTPLNKYLDKPLIKDNHNFLFKTADIRVAPDSNPNDAVDDGLVTTWFLGYKLGSARQGVKNNLAKQAASVGLYGTPLTSIDLTSNTPGYYTGGNEVYIIVQ